MPRTPRVPGHPATISVNVKFTETDIDAIDDARVDVGVSTYIRSVVREKLGIVHGPARPPKVKPTSVPPAPGPGLPDPPQPEVHTGAVTTPVGSYEIPGKDVGPHLCTMETVATRTVRGHTINTRKCTVCEKVIER